MEVIWDPVATDLATRFLAGDPNGLSQLIAAIDSLADEPIPPAAAQLGTSNLYRLRAGCYRAVYEITDTPDRIQVRHVDRR